MVVLNCKECGQSLLDDKNKKRYLEGKTVTNEGCVVNPKIINGKEYRRNKCYECFETKFGRKPKGLNTVHYDMCYLMGVPEEEIKEHRKELAVTKENMIKRYGEKHGLERWNRYCKKQAEVNTFEYKKEKYGWSEEQFKSFNESRAVTLENCIERHGTEKGTQIFNDYCEKQSYVGCKEEYFVEKYGKREGRKKYKQINKQKKLTAENFIRKHGKELGEKKFKEWLHRSNPSYSSIANELFDELSKHVTYKHYYQANGGEYGVWLHDMDSYVKIDFYVLELNKSIEFYGDYWHCNPNKYEPSFYNTRSKKTAEETWRNDADKIKYLKEEHKIETLTIWESEYNHNKDQVIKKCLRFLGVNDE